MVKLKKPTFSFPLRKKATATTMEPSVGSTPESTPESDPIMEDREDACETVETPIIRTEERDEEGSPAPRDEGSVMTESKEDKVDVLPSLKEEASKEAEEMALDDVTYEQKNMPSLDDASSTTSHSGYHNHTPASSPAFCSCFGF
ncbi:hypothetical protein ACHAXA_010159 [Cyclostephanos tholiformis]|uniref:Uncharacterized protein n=1 Tax=Cyclostephanos tholiformis TaxID=382380 RepID=A0ABD3RS63_9STRA